MGYLSSFFKYYQSTGESGRVGRADAVGQSPRESSQFTKGAIFLAENGPFGASTKGRHTRRTIRIDCASSLATGGVATLYSR
jgi:hypothetical protein